MEDYTETESPTDILNQGPNLLSPDTLAVLRQAEYDRDTSIFTPSPPPTLIQEPTEPNQISISRPESPTQEGEIKSEVEEPKESQTPIKTYESMNKKANNEIMTSSEANLEASEVTILTKVPPQTELEKLLQGFMITMNTTLSSQLGQLQTNMLDDTQAQLGQLQTNLDNKLDDNSQKLETDIQKLDNKLDDNSQKLETLETNFNSKLNELDSNTQGQLTQLHSALTNIEIKIRQEVETKLDEYRQNIIEETDTKMAINRTKIKENKTQIIENTTKLEKLKAQVETHIQKIEKTLTESKNIIDKENKDYKNMKVTQQKDKTTNLTKTNDIDEYMTESKEGRNLKVSNALANLIREDKPMFDGYYPEKFLEKLETYVRSFRLTEQETLENLHIFLKDKALQWWNLIKVDAESWEDAKTRILEYWVNKDIIKQRWENLTCKPYFDIEMFVLQALELQGQLKPDRLIEKKIEKVTMKLPSPMKEMMFIKKSKTIEQYLTDIKELRKIYGTRPTNLTTQDTTDKKNYNYQPTPNKTMNRVIYNTNFGRNNRQTPTEETESAFYNWDQKGNAYDPKGICIWESKWDHPKKGKKYIGAITPVQDGPTQVDNTDNLN